MKAARSNLSREKFLGWYSDSCARAVHLTHWGGHWTNTQTRRGGSVEVGLSDRVGPVGGRQQRLVPEAEAGRALSAC